MLLLAFVLTSTQPHHSNTVVWFEKVTMKGPAYHMYFRYVVLQVRTTNLLFFRSCISRFLFILKKIFPIVVGPKSSHISQHTCNGASLPTREQVGQRNFQWVRRLHHVPNFIAYILYAQVIVPTLNPFLMNIPAPPRLYKNQWGMRYWINGYSV